MLAWFVAFFAKNGIGALISGLLTALTGQVISGKLGLTLLWLISLIAAIGGTIWMVGIGKRMFKRFGEEKANKWDWSWDSNDTSDLAFMIAGIIIFYTPFFVDLPVALIDLLTK
jgi:hypothetical protein